VPDIGRGGVHVPTRDARPAKIQRDLSTSPIYTPLSNYHLLVWIKSAPGFWVHNARPLDATMTSRIVPQILDPLNPSALNKLHEPTPPTKKRKRSSEQTQETHNAAGQLATTTIVIRVSETYSRKAQVLAVTHFCNYRHMQRLYPMNP
jgi:hypothetical protein